MWQKGEFLIWCDSTLPASFQLLTTPLDVLQHRMKGETSDDEEKVTLGRAGKNAPRVSSSMDESNVEFIPTSKALTKEAQLQVSYGS